MQLDKLKLRAPYVIVEVNQQENATKSGILVSENTDDFLLVGTVVLSSDTVVDSIEIKQGTSVMFHVLNGESFRDGSKSYYLLDSTHIRGIYGN